MTHDVAASIVSEVTYRPGWTIEFYLDPSGASVLRVGTVERDSEHRNPLQPVSPVIYTDALTSERLSPMDTREFLQWVYDVFHRRVEHELREWLRLRGRPLYEPHPEKGWTRGVIG